MIIDNQGLAVLELQVSRQPVVIGNPITVQAEVSDVGLGGLPITGVQYELQDDGGVREMATADGAFDSPVVALRPRAYAGGGGRTEGLAG